MIGMQLDTTLRYSMMNELTVRERIYLGARERYNIVQEDDRDDKDDRDDCAKPNRLECPSRPFRPRQSFPVRPWVVTRGSCQEWWEEHVGHARV